jgi:spermidine/putrescine transport system substrate-binding protein
MLHDDFKKFPGHWAARQAALGHGALRPPWRVLQQERCHRRRGDELQCFWKPELKGKVGHFDWHLPSLGMMSLTNGNGAGLWDLDDAKWAAVQETTMSLRPQVGGFFDYGGTFNSLKNGEMQAMCGIGDWITGVLEKDGAPVASWSPKEGGIQWTESYCIGKGSEKAEIVKKFIQYMLSPEGQVKSAQMAAYPGLCHHQGGPRQAERGGQEGSRAHGQVDGMANDPITLIKEGRIHYRDIPKQQSLEDWNDFWSEYKNA